MWIAVTVDKAMCNQKSMPEVAADGFYVLDFLSCDFIEKWDGPDMELFVRTYPRARDQATVTWTSIAGFSKYLCVLFRATLITYQQNFIFHMYHP